MPEYFDTTLAEALDLVAASKPSPGAATARARGGRRTVRRRITTSAMICVLVTGGVAAGFRAAATHGSRADQAAAAGSAGSGPRDPNRIVPEAMLSAADSPGEQPWGY